MELGITTDAVISTANFTAQQAMARLHSDIDLCHKRGYHAYAAALGNMKTKIERALSELVDELED